MFLSFDERRLIGECFYPAIHLDCSWDDIDEQLEIANHTEKAVKQMLDGKISAEEMLELIEDCFNMDAYLDEVEENLDKTAQTIFWLQ